MKINFIRRLVLGVALLSTTLFIGCKTTPPVDWNSRVGNYTYDQAVVDLGPPDKKETLSDGSVVAEWIKHRNGGTSVGLGMGYGSGAGVGLGVGQSIGSGYPDRILKLIFGTDHRLTSWSKTN